MEYYLQDLDSFKHWQATGYVQKVIFYDIVQANQNILFDVLHPSQWFFSHGISWVEQLPIVQ